MNTHAKKTIIGISIAAALMTACSSKQQMTKPSGDEFDSSEPIAQVAKAQPAAIIPVMPAPPQMAPAIMPVSQIKSPPMQAATDCSKHQFDDGGKPENSVKIRVTGYGAPPKAFYPDPQRRLMAMRAAKIDAYRSLAERVTGIQIWGGTTIGDMVVEKDRFRVYIDTFITGARVIAENPLDDGTFETIVELTVGQPFLTKTLPNKRRNDCMKSASYPSQNIINTANAGSMAKPNFY